MTGTGKAAEKVEDNHGACRPVRLTNPLPFYASLMADFCRKLIPVKSQSAEIQKGSDLPAEIPAGLMS